MLAGWLVAFIAMQMASTPHAASTAREKHEETRGRQGLDAARIRTFSRVSLPSLLLLFPTFFTLFHPLSTILRSLLVSTLSSLPLFHSPLSSQFSSRFFLALAISRNMRLHSASISFLLFLAIVIHERIHFFAKKKERKQRDQGRKKQNSMTLAISKWQLNYHIFRYLRSNLALILQESIRKNGKKNSSDSSHSFLPQWHLIHDRKNCGVVCASRKGGEGFRLINR